MRTIRGGVFQSVDGVMQAPGTPTEDPTGGFELGGWVAGNMDSAVGTAISGLFAPPYELLLGRRTYDIFAAHWPYVPSDDPMGQGLNAARKHVLTRSDAPLEWENSRRLADLDAVAALKATDGPDLLIQGSSTLYPALLARGLLDRVTVMTFPVVLGHGKRVFDGPASSALRLVDHQVGPAGVIVATYEPAGPVGVASFALPETSARETERRRRMAKGSW